MSSKISSIRRRQSNQEDYKNKPYFILGPFDKWLFFIIQILCIFGLFMVFSASAPEGVKPPYNDAWIFVKKQLLFDLIGFVLMIIISRLDYKIWRKIAIPLAIAVILLVLSTYFFGEAQYGAERWLKLGPFSFQPSEFGKLAAILLAAEAMAYSKSMFSTRFIVNIAIIGIMIFLILKQPSLSIALITSASTFIVLFMGGFPLIILIPVLIGGFAAVVKVIQKTPYQLDRILGWLNPWAYPQDKGYNIIQSWYAFGAGGIFGVGFSNSKQKLAYLPFEYTDFIFAIIAEELGLIGSLMVLSLFVLFTYIGFKISFMCESVYGRLLAIGITSSISVQALINMGVASGVLPPTGITLPLISYGGSSSLAIFCMLGILLNISRKRIPRIT